MSPKNQVFSLNYLCLKTISAQLIQALSDYESLNNAIVESYLLGTTFEVLEELLKNILNSANLDAGTRLNCLEILLRKDVRKLDTGIFPHSYYKKILELITIKGTGLQQLNLKGVWVRDYPFELSQLVMNLKNLKVLIIPHMADDEVLEAVMMCKKLSVLDISGESAFSVQGLKLLKSDTIKVLEIGNYGKKDICQEEHDSYELMAEIIENMPNLSSLRIYSYTAKPLLLIYNKNSNFKTKLTYLHDTDTNFEEFNAIVNLCPNLESIHIANPEENVINQLTKLKKLNCLKLSRPHIDELLNFLTVSGSRLQILKLNLSKDCALDLSQICLLAPNLTTLECFKISLNCLQPETYFMCLENLEILYCNISNTNLIYLMSNTPFLKRLIVGDFIYFTDGDIFRLCAECDFASLEEFWFSCAQGLTINSVELLMRHCPNLKTVGQLNGWGLSALDVEYLRAVIESSNMDLTLLPEGVFT